MQPEALNRVEKGTVLGQPDDQDTVLVEAQSSFDRFTVVVGSVVHHQDEVLTGIFRQQMLQKSDKRIAVFVGRGQVTNPSCMPIVAAKDVEKLRTSGGRD